MRLVLLALLPVPPLALVAAGWVLRRGAAAEPTPSFWTCSRPTEPRSISRSWIDFYQSLYAIATPRWKSWFIGQPWLSFELWAAEDAIRVRCWLPARLETLVTTQLRSALPGIEIREADRGGDLPAIAARSRLRLHRDSLYALGNPRPEPLVAVMNALSSVAEGVVQLVIQPDVGWQGQAQRRLDVLTGVRPAPLTLGSLLTGALDFLFDLVLPSQGQQSGRPKPSHPIHFRQQGRLSSQAIGPSCGCGSPDRRRGRQRHAGTPSSPPFGAATEPTGSGPNGLARRAFRPPAGCPPTARWQFRRIRPRGAGRTLSPPGGGRRNGGRAGTADTAKAEASQR